MTVDQVIDTLKLEKQQRVPSRFPCRAIMVGNIAESHLWRKAEGIRSRRGESTICLYIGNIAIFWKS